MCSVGRLSVAAAVDPDGQLLVSWFDSEARSRTDRLLDTFPALASQRGTRKNPPQLGSCHSTSGTFCQNGSTSPIGFPSGSTNWE